MNSRREGGVLCHPRTHVIPLSSADLPVVGLDEVGEVLGLLESVVVVTVVVVVAVVLGTEVLHLVDAAALGASLDGAVAGDLEQQILSVSRYLPQVPVSSTL